MWMVRLHVRDEVLVWVTIDRRLTRALVVELNTPMLAAPILSPDVSSLEASTANTTLTDTPPSIPRIDRVRIIAN